jgi:hypothetical protein
MHTNQPAYEAHPGAVVSTPYAGSKRLTVPLKGRLKTVCEQSLVAFLKIIWLVV